MQAFSITAPGSASERTFPKKRHEPHFLKLLYNSFYTQKKTLLPYKGLAGVYIGTLQRNAYPSVQEPSPGAILQIIKVILYGTHMVSKSLSSVRMECYILQLVRHNYEFSPLLAKK